MPATFDRIRPIYSHLAMASLALMMAIAVPIQARASDHVDAPSILTDGRADINDTYFFTSPADPGRTVLIMTVNPLAGILSPVTFNSNISYEFNIDKNNDTRPDLTYVCRFSSFLPNGQQRLHIRYLFDGQDVSAGAGLVGETFSIRGGGSATAGVFDDPFFFDFLGFSNGFSFTGSDFFAGFNVSAIVIELPNERVGARDRIGFWGRTRLFGIQQDRVGLPALNTALISDSDEKDFYNQSEPYNDIFNFYNTFEDSITGLSGDRDYAAAVTMVLLPDILILDRSQPTDFLNGRKLEDDVIDVELQVLSNGGVMGDGVDSNDKPFLLTFPYLAAPH